MPTVPLDSSAHRCAGGDGGRWGDGGAHRHDVTQLLPLVNRIPAVVGRRGCPRRRPDQVQGDRASMIRKRGIRALLAQRGQAHGSDLGVYRWVVERTLGWLHQFRRLRVR